MVWEPTMAGLAVFGESAGAGDALRDHARRQVDEIRSEPAVERQFEHAAVFHYLTDPGGFGLNLRGGGFDLHLLAHLADLEGDVDGRAGGDLEDEPALDVSTESGFANFQTIGSDGKIGEHVVASRAALRGARNPGIRLDRFYFSAGNGGTGGVEDRALYLCVVLQLRPEADSAQGKEKRQDADD